MTLAKFGHWNSPHSLAGFFVEPAAAEDEHPGNGSDTAHKAPRASGLPTPLAVVSLNAAGSLVLAPGSGAPLTTAGPSPLPAALHRCDRRDR